MMPMSFTEYFWILGLSGVYILLHIVIDKLGRKR